MNKYISGLLLSTFIFSTSCSPSHDEAQARLDAARSLYKQGNYVQAKLEIDSITILHSKSFEQRKQGIALLDTVRHAENEQTIRVCDSLMAINAPRIDSIKKLFVFQKDAKYQDTGYYLPKQTATSAGLTHTTLRSGVGEDGNMYLESVFIGVQQHNKIRANVSGGESIESQVVTDDGLNYRFENLGKQFEVVRFVGDTDNGIAKLIEANADKNITIVLDGKGKTSFTLSKALKTAISNSYYLSQIMLYNDSLSTEKEKAEFKIRFLENRDEIQQINKELKDNDEVLEHARPNQNSEE